MKLDQSKKECDEDEDDDKGTKTLMATIVMLLMAKNSNHFSLRQTYSEMLWAGYELANVIHCQV